MTSKMQEEPQQYKPPKIKKYPQKITQMQCSSTNNQLMQFFMESLNESFKYMPNILSKIYFELQLLVGFFQYRLTIAENQPHPGDLLQNLKYVPQSLTQTKKLMYLFLTVLLPYIKRRLYNYAISQQTGWKQKIVTIINYIDKALNILNLINYAYFIYKGKYRSLTQTVLKIPMQFINSKNSRVLNFSLMNRRMIWGIYQLFLKTMLPFLHGYFSKVLKNMFYLSSYLQVDNSQPNCIYCGEPSTMTMIAKPCKHLSCYYCMMNNYDFESKQAQKCQKCTNTIQKWDNTY